MNVYFAGSIRGTQLANQAEINASILSYIRIAGHHVVSEHTLVTDKHRMDQWTDAQIFRQDCLWVSQADAMIAECSGPSHGVGYEIGLAEHRGIPVLVLHHLSVRVSAMLIGNPHLTIGVYGSPSTLAVTVREFLESAAVGIK